MRRQIQTAKPLAPEAGHTCGECGQGTFENLSLEGKPTLVSCPFQPFKMVVSERACSHFKPMDNYF